MKTILSFVVVFALELSGLFAQNTSPWPSTGNVGIGTSSPTVTLDVNGAALVRSSALGPYSGLVIGEPHTSSSKELILGYNTTDNYGALQAVHQGTAYTPLILQPNGGKVGIGTATPGALFEISQSFTDHTASFMRLTNTSSAGQTGLDYYINGTLRGKTRADYDGNLNFISNGGSHYFFTGGDSGTGSIRMKVGSDGNVGIGTTSPDSKLTVAGKIHAREIKVSTSAGADFVFSQHYPLPSLDSLEKFVLTHKHLPDIAPAKEMVANGIELGEMNIKLLQKIEELTLYLIEQKKEIGQLKERLGRIEKK